MLAGKKLTDYTKMNKCNFIEYNSIEAIGKTNLSEQTKFRLAEISKIENYFIKEINQRKLCSQKLKINMLQLLII